MANTGMKGLLVWCKKYTQGYRDVNVTNMSSSWKDGLAFCALLHRFRPDLIDFQSLSKENVFYNNQLAFEIAEKELGIAALLDAEDMANMKSPDRLSVMTYLSQYYSCFRHCNLEDNKPQNVPPVVNPASPAKIFSLPRRPTDESICCICRKRVHLVQRYFEGGELHHRTCHRTKSLQKIRGRNYFGKQQQKRRETEVDAVNKDKCDTSYANALLRTRTEVKPKMRRIDLPNLVESPSNAINISASSPPPVTEDQKLPNALHTEPSSLKSELPKNMESQEGIATGKAHLDVPRPRARTFRRSTEVGGRVSPAPVAQPRSKVNQKPAECEKLDYNEPLNPFGTDSGSDSEITLSGSDSDTTLSSESSEEDFNLFENVGLPKKPVVPRHSPVVVMKELPAVNDFTEVNEGNPFENTNEEKSDKTKQEASDEECGNPFGVCEEEVQATQTKVRQHKASDRFNPFSPDFKDLADKEKRKPAPVPPPKIKSPHKKAPALPPPPEWKQSASSKMLELNKTAPRFTHNNQSSKPPRPPAPSQSPTKTINNHAAKHEKGPTRRKTRSAPGYGHPLVKRRVEIKMSEEEMTTELKLLDIKLTDYETKGVKLEQMLRFAMDSDAEWTSEESELLQEWFDLVNKKNILLREESELVFQMQQQRLEQEHADVEFQMRKLLNKPDSAKTDQDKIEEEELLKRLVEVVERRDVIINSIEEERHKEVEEDMAYAQMRKLQQKQSKKKKKNKVKKMFSKKDKNKKEKKHAAKEQKS